MTDPHLHLTLDVPAELARGVGAGALAGEVLRLLVLDRFRRGEVTAAAAARLLGLGRVAFLDLCAAHGVSPVQVDLEDLRRELAGIVGSRK